MKNKLTDLNNHLFAQLERLSDESLKGDALSEEISRAKAVSQISGQIIGNGRLVLDAQLAGPNLGIGRQLPPMLESKA